MNIYIALLRGINVGTKNRMKMSELKTVLEGLGLERVQTYIQSGNVLFCSDEAEAAVHERITTGLQSAFGFPIGVVLRTAGELEEILSCCPFSAQDIAEAEAASDAESLYVLLWDGMPDEKKAARVQVPQGEQSRFCIMGRNVYLLFHESIRASKLAPRLEKLCATATVRNWNTLTQMHVLAQKMKREG